MKNIHFVFSIFRLLRSPMSDHKNLTRFAEIIKKLRSPGGCPWDREQSHKTLKPYLIEETYEVLDAIDKNNSEELKDELGDLLLQVFLHAQIASDNCQFTIDDVADVISNKMIRRHPHVFGDVKVKNSDEVLDNWIEIKKNETLEKNGKEISTLSSIPENLPALFENFKISKRVAKLGFEWEKPFDIFAKIDEEIAEIKEAIQENNQDKIQEEMGDLLFTVSNLCRAYKINSELALKDSNKKFRKRFQKMEEAIHKENLDPQTLTLNQWNDLWKKIKSL